MSNYKSYVGVDNVYIALVSQDDASAYAAGTPQYLAPVMSIAQAPKVNSKVQYADDQPFDSMMSEGETEMDVEITGIPLADLATLLGRVYDQVNGMLFDNGGVPPYVALGFRSQKADGEYRYYWFLKGKFNSPSEDMSTKTDSPDPKSVKLKFIAIRTVHEFALSATVTDSVKRVVGDTSVAVFSETGWFTTVKVPVVGSPSALTCTPSPADGATGVSKTNNLTLTFNNAIVADAEDGIVLIATATQAIVACARTIDAARKVVTLDPTSDLAGTTDYIIVVPGVVDIYGQALADAVYNFTTAA
jgi:phi13 family phage major tail protein